MDEKALSFHGLTQEHLAVLALLEREEDEFTRTELAKYLGRNAELVAGKVDAYVYVARTLEGTARGQREEAAHLAEMARANENAVQRLKETAKECAEELGIKKFEGNTRTITVSDGGVAIEIVSEVAVPDRFKTQIISYKVDKAAISDWIGTTGEVVPGVQAREVKRVLMR